MADFRTFITEIFDRRFPRAQMTRREKDTYTESQWFDFWVDRVRYQVIFDMDKHNKIASVQFKSSKDGGQTYTVDGLTNDAPDVRELFTRLRDLISHWFNNHADWTLTFGADHRKGKFYQMLVSRIFIPSQVKIETTSYGTFFEIRK